MALEAISFPHFWHILLKMATNLKLCLGSYGVPKWVPPRESELAELSEW